MTDFSAAVLGTCKKRHLLGARDRVLVALSGGPDSTALLSVMRTFRDGGRIAGLSAVHVDHGLRPGSAEDARSCAALCSRLGVDLRCVSVKVGPGNVQAEARRARYAALRREATRVGATRIATGHTLDDQAETVLLRLLRGSGARGLAGIPPRRGPFVRPLLDRSREEVLAHLRDAGLPHLVDPTNATPRFLRNRVRAELLPALRAIAPHAARALGRAADLLRDDERALAAQGRRIAPDGSARVSDLLAAPLAVRRRAVRELWRRASGSRRGLDARHVDGALALLRRPGPGRAPLPGGLEAWVRYGELEVRAAPRASVPPTPVPIPGPGTHTLPGGGFLEVDEAPGATWPLWWRTRRPGDRFRPAGGGGGKKLKAWLIDRKVPRETRDGLRVLADDEGRVLWIPELAAWGEKPSARARLRA